MDYFVTSWRFFFLHVSSQCCLWFYSTRQVPISDCSSSPIREKTARRRTEIILLVPLYSIKTFFFPSIPKQRVSLCTLKIVQWEIRCHIGPQWLNASRMQAANASSKFLAAIKFWKYYIIHLFRSWTRSCEHHTLYWAIR